MIWIIIIPILLSLFYIGEHSNRNASIFAKFCIVLLLSYLVAFGGAQATDYINYATKYRYYTTLSSIYDFSDILSFDKSTTVDFDNYGPLFKLLCFLCYKIGLSGTGFIFVVSLLTNYFLVKVLFSFKKATISGFLLIVGGILLLEANLVRQTLCVAIFLYSLRFLNKKQPIQFILLISIISLIHYASFSLFIFVPLLFVDFGDKTKKIVNKLLVCFSFLSLTLALGFFNVSNIASSPLLSMLLGDTIYAGYLSSENTVGATLSINYIYNIVIVFLLFYKKPEDFIFTLVVAIGCITINLSMAIPNMYRLSIYFSTLFPIYFSTILNTKYYTKSLRRSVVAINKLMLLFYVLFSYIYVMIIRDSNVIGQTFLPIDTLFR